ncbi:zf-TFIIB domain-containing protein [Nocardia sp. NBC_00511]|uniref:zf-TFIIB domain-containing protein n=1 Tax=Nocardia sp. NBC_00511 TaxID=2903591 RepID=UPI003867FC89
MVAVAATLRNFIWDLSSVLRNCIEHRHEVPRAELCPKCTLGELISMNYTSVLVGRCQSCGGSPTLSNRVGRE